MFDKRFQFCYKYQSSSQIYFKEITLSLHSIEMYTSMTKDKLTFVPSLDVILDRIRKGVLLMYNYTCSS